ncbi:MAG TPA: sugar ABC transporter permease [Candidatus Faecimorpha stercoravium]|nr:sugar ABC transporter permease [Candidatus Faecimorpha stercoravium]
MVLAHDTFRRRASKDMKRNWPLYLMVLPVVIFYILFCYKPIVGIIIAFKDYKPNLGIWGSPWTSQYGLYHFISFFDSIFFARVCINTIMISLYSLVFGFPAPIILALLMNELRSQKFKRVVQTITYFPHFVSTVVICGMVRQFCLSDGLFNEIGSWFGAQPQSLLQVPEYFRAIYTATGVWQGVGWSSIIYLAAIAGVDSGLHEAAALDGAGRFRRIWHITLPGIKPTIVILLIMQIGGMMSVGYEKIILLYNESIYETADVISTFVYRRGLLEFNWSFSTAVNLFNSVLNFILVFTANAISRKVTETSLF